MWRCRTDFTSSTRELPGIKYPVVPAVTKSSARRLHRQRCHDAPDRRPGGIPWLGYNLRHLPFLQGGHGKSLRSSALHRYTRDGGFATHAIADARYAFPLGEDGDMSRSRVLCAGLIGWARW